MPKILDAFTNFARTSLISGINTSATVFSTVANGDYNRFPDGTDGNFKLTIYNSTDYKNPSDDPLREIVWCSSRSANTFTIIRPVAGNNYLNEGATNIAQNHNLGNKTYSIVLSVTKGTIDAIDTKLQTIDTNDTQTVHITGNESIDGIKTFTSSPIIPAPTTDMEAATKKYVDDQIGGENLFDRSGNTITTHIAGDNLDIGGIVKTDTINEYTTNNGTTVNGVLIKSGLVDGVSVSGHAGNSSIHFTQGAISIPHTQINDFNSAVDSEISNQLTAQKGAANGIATLDTNTQVPIAQIPNITSAKVTDFQTAVDTNTNVAANTAARHSHSNKSTLDLINQDVSNTATPTFNQVTVNNTPTNGNDVATKSYVDSNVALKLAQIQAIVTNPATLTPSIGQRWIIGVGAIGVWSGKDNKIAKWNGTGWDYTDAVNGQREYNLALDVDYEFKGGSWVVLADSIEHNKTKNIQGGNSTEKYHLTSAEHDIATQPASDIVSGYINTSTQNISGVKTFGDIPVIPTTTPTLDGQVSSKSYVDYNINQLNRFDKQLFHNQSGSTIVRYTVVQVNGSYGLDNLPTIIPFSGGSNTPIALTYEDLLNNTTDTLLIRGRQDITGFDTTSFPIGSKVYASPSGTLSLIPTGFAIGITMNQQVNGYVYFDFSGIFNYTTPPLTFDSLSWQNPVISNLLITPPISPTLNDRYLLPTGCTGVWSGKDNSIAIWNGLNWTFVIPVAGETVFNNADSKYYTYKSGLWTGLYPEDVYNKSTDITMGGLTPSDTLYSSQKAVKTYVDTSISSLPKPFTFKGGIAVASDFPTLALVQNGWVYAISANVTDNNPAKTNTGMSFIAGDEIVWNGSTWINIGPNALWKRTGTDISTVNVGDNIDFGTGGLKDTNVTTAIKLGDSSNTSLNTINKTIVGSSNEINTLLLNELSNGVKSGFTISINISTTTIDIAAGKAIILNDSNPASPTITPINFAGLTNITLTNIATANATYLAINSSGVIVQKTSPFSESERRTYVILGVAIHSNRVNVNAINNLPDVSLNASSQVNDLMDGLKGFNYDGNKFSFNGANLNINKTAGNIFKKGANFVNNPLSPHIVPTPNLTAPTNIRYRLQNSIEYANTAVIDPSNYDNAGVLTAIGGNKFTIQRINLFTSNLVRIQYGQTLYNSMSSAIQAISNETFVTEQNIQDNGLLRGILVVKNGATNLSDLTQAQFFEVDRFGSLQNLTAGGGTTTLQQAYVNSVQPQIVTDATGGALQIKRGSAADTDKVLEVLNGAGASTASVLGDGTINSAPLTASTILSADASKNIASLPLATYPSLTELSYVKGVTSAIQPQLNGKEPTLTKGNLTEVTTSSLTITGGTGAVIGSGTTIALPQDIKTSSTPTFTDVFISSLNRNSTTVGLDTKINTGIPISEKAKFKVAVTYSAPNISVQISFVGANTSFSYYINDKKYTVSAGNPILNAITATAAEGVWFLYVSQNNVLTLTQTPWNIYDPDVLLWNFTWNATNNTATWIGHEKHTAGRDIYQHARNHAQGAIYKSGLLFSQYNGLSAFATNTDNNFGRAQVQVSGGSFFDEDIINTIVHTDTSITSTTTNPNTTWDGNVEQYLGFTDTNTSTTAGTITFASSHTFVTGQAITVMAGNTTTVRGTFTINAGATGTSFVVTTVTGSNAFANGDKVVVGARIPIYYISSVAGSNYTWRRLTTSDFVGVSGGAAITAATIATAVPQYNDPVNGGFVNCTSIRYFPVYLMATNFTSEPVIAILGQGQSTNNTLATALTEAPFQFENLVGLKGLGIQEQVPFYRLSYRYDSGAGQNANRMRLVDAIFTDIRVSTATGTVITTAPTTLSASNVITDTTNFNNNLSTADATVQNALDTIDNLGAALTKTDDTNVTLTLGGTPATSLLKSVSLTLGWTGTLADARIASAATWNAKQVAYTNLTTIGSLANANGFLRQNGAGVFSYDTSTYYLASNPSGYTSNLGTVTSVAALTLGTTGTDLSSTVATGTTTPVITLNVPTASSANRGALSAADWTTFNNKLGQIIDITYANLVSAISGSTLIKGQKYRITDYKTIYMNNALELSTIVSDTTVEPLIVTAIKNNVLSPIAFSEAYPNDVIYYDVTTATLINGGIISIPITNGGTGYTTALPTITCTLGGASVQATAIVQAKAGVINQIFITNNGTGYTSAPTITITGGNGANFAVGVPTLYTQNNMGTITRRINTTYNIDLPYDWRQIKFKRYSLDMAAGLTANIISTWAPSTAYTQGQFLYDGTTNMSVVRVVKAYTSSTLINTDYNNGNIVNFFNPNTQKIACPGSITRAWGINGFGGFQSPVYHYFASYNNGSIIPDNGMLNIYIAPNPSNYTFVSYSSIMPDITFIKSDNTAITTPVLLNISINALNKGRVCFLLDNTRDFTCKQGLFFTNFGTVTYSNVNYMGSSLGNNLSNFIGAMSATDIISNNNGNCTTNYISNITNSKIFSNTFSTNTWSTMNFSTFSGVQVTGNWIGGQFASQVLGTFQNNVIANFNSPQNVIFEQSIGVDYSTATNLYAATYGKRVFAESGGTYKLSYFAGTTLTVVNANA